MLLQELATFRATNPFPAASAAVYSPGLQEEPVAVTTGPIKADALLLAGSVGKTFFAAAALKLSEQGILDLDEPIRAYLPDLDLPGAEVVTARRLLSHRSGYPTYDRDFMEALVQDPRAVRTLADWTGPIRRQVPTDVAGAGYAYSDINYILLAAVIEGTAGESASAVIDRLF